MALEKMDDLFGVTELVKKLDEDEEADHASSTGEKVDEKGLHVEITSTR